MSDHNIAQAVSQGNGTAVCGIDLGNSYCAVVPVSETLRLPEPDFEELKPLYSSKPLRFNALRQLP